MTVSPYHRRVSATRMVTSPVLAGVALVAGLLAGCATAAVPPGVAATAGSDVITVAELQAEVTELAAVAPGAVDLEGDLSGVQSQVLSRQLVGVVVGAVADEAGIEVPPATVDAFIKEASTASGGIDVLLEQNLLTEQTLESAVEQTLAVQQLQQAGVDVQAAVTAKADELAVTVNPRYGTWEQLSVVPGTGAIAVAGS